MEKISSIEKVIGKKLSEEKKGHIMREFQEKFSDQKFEELCGFERKKTPEEILIINLVNDATNELLNIFGLPEFNIPPDNFHIMYEEKWKERVRKMVPGTSAFFSWKNQGVAMREEETKLIFAVNTFHEMIHFKSRGILLIKGKNVQASIAKYRLGLEVRKKSGNKLYFRHLNEAVTEDLARRFLRRFKGNPLFENEITETQRIRDEHFNAADSKGNPFFTEDTYFIKPIDEKRFFKANFAFPQERKILNTLIDKIFERNKEEFKDREEVFKLLLRRCYQAILFLWDM